MKQKVVNIHTQHATQQKEKDSSIINTKQTIIIPILLRFCC